MPAPLTSDSRPRRGRPPRFSRDQIVVAVAEMLAADPETPLTIAGAAEAVGAAPMSLYRHFADRDDLVAAVAQHVFADARAPVEPSTPWQEQVRMWMSSVYDKARAVPQLMRLMAAGESREWMAHAAYIAGALERAGVDDDRVLAEGVFWVATTTMSHAMIGAGRWEPAADLERIGHEHLEAEAEHIVARLVPHLEAMQFDAFDRVITWTIAGLERMLDPPGPRRSPSRLG